MPTYTIQGSAIQLSTLYSQPYQIRNSGTKTIYLGKDTSVSNTQYDWSLSPGDTLGFSADTYLYLVCAPGESSQLEQQYGALGNFTPGPSTVLARLANTLTALETRTFTVNAAAGSDSQADSVIDVSDYSSILLTVQITTPGGTPFVFTEQNWVQLFGSLVDSDQPTALQNNSYSPKWMLVNSPISGLQVSSIQIPVTSQFFDYGMYYEKLATATGGLITTRLYGSNEAIVTPRYLHVAQSVANTLVSMGQLQKNAVGLGTTTQPFQSRNGTANLTIFRNSVTTFLNCKVFMSDGSFNVIAAIGLNDSIELSKSVLILLPYMPIRVELTETGAAGFAGITITM